MKVAKAQTDYLTSGGITLRTSQNNVFPTLFPAKSVQIAGHLGQWQKDCLQGVLEHVLWLRLPMRALTVGSVNVSLAQSAFNNHYFGRDVLSLIGRRTGLSVFA